MVLFREFWESGKFALEAKRAEECAQRQKASTGLDAFLPDFGETGISENSKEILRQLRPKRGQETGRWLREISPRKNEPEAKPSVFSKADTIEDTVVWMDALFSQFADLSYEYNKSAYGSDLLISCTPPAISERTSTDEWYRSSTKTFQGRLTTKQWALIVRGVNTKIDIFILPTAALLAFSAGQLNDDAYPPFTALVRSLDSGEWTIGGEAVPFSSVSNLAKELLGDLIRVSSGVMAQSELFSRVAAPPALGENLAVGYDSAPAKVYDGSEQSVAAIHDSDSDTITMADACDLVDSIVEQDLIRLYAKAAACQPSSAHANTMRLQISAIEIFRVRMSEAFEQYALNILPFSTEVVERPASEDVTS
jgi:hypothetical protein